MVPIISGKQETGRDEVSGRTKTCTSVVTFDSAMSRNELDATRRLNRLVGTAVVAFVFLGTSYFVVLPLFAAHLLSQKLETADFSTPSPQVKALASEIKAINALARLRAALSRTDLGHAPQSKPPSGNKTPP